MTQIFNMLVGIVKRLSRSEVKGQGHSETRYTSAAETYMSTVWHRGFCVCARIT